MRAQKWRSFVAQSFLFLFSAQEDRLSSSSEGGRGPEQLISVQASPWGMQGRYHGDTCRREDPAWSRFLNGWGASADDHECRPRLDRICASGGPGGPPLASQSAVDHYNHAALKTHVYSRYAQNSPNIQSDPFSLTISRELSWDIQVGLRTNLFAETTLMLTNTFGILCLFTQHIVLLTDQCGY